MPEDDDAIDIALGEFSLTGEQVCKDIQKALSNRKSASVGLAQYLMNADGDNDDQSNEKENQSTSNGRGSRATKPTARKSTASKATPVKTTTSGRGRGSTRGRAAASSNASVRKLFIEFNY